MAFGYRRLHILLLRDGRRIDHKRTMRVKKPRRRRGAARRLVRPPVAAPDHGIEFVSQLLDQWAHRHKVQWGFIRPGKPVEKFDLV